MQKPKTRCTGLLLRRFHNKLHTLLVVPLVDVEPIGYVGVFGQGGGAVKPDGINQLALVAQLQFEVFVFEQALLQHLHFFAKDGRIKALPPDFLLQECGSGGVAVLGGQGAVGVDGALQGGSIKPFAGDLCECLRENVKLFAGYCAACGGGVPAKAQ